MQFQKNPVQKFMKFVKITSNLEELKPKNNHDNSKNKEKMNSTFSVRHQDIL